MKSKIQRPYEILAKQLKHLQKQNRNYSLRSLARDLDLSVSFVSDIFKGKRPIPKSRILSFKRSLKMDEIKAKLFDQSLDQEIINKMPLLKNSFEQNLFKSSLADYTEITQKHFPILRHWYNVAIMDLVTCHDFDPDPAKIAVRLGIKNIEAKNAITLLESEGLIKFENGIWSKTSKQIRFPARFSTEAIRGIHSQLIKIALNKLLTETSPEKYQERLINGVMFAANPANLDKAKSRLNDALYEVAEILTEGECTEVYQLNCQLFPLSKR